MRAYYGPSLGGLLTSELFVFLAMQREILVSAGLSVGELVGPLSGLN